MLYVKHKKNYFCVISLQFDLTGLPYKDEESKKKDLEMWMKDSDKRGEHRNLDLWSADNNIVIPTWTKYVGGHRNLYL
jgi:hypothetical protein